MSSAEPDGRPVRAAGGVVWRRRQGRTEVALIHRPRYDDWTFPKGKLRRGETELIGALREVREETGIDVRVAQGLGSVRYATPGAAKSVAYWAMAWRHGAFAVNDEADDMMWMSAAAARRQLSYPADVDVLERFTALDDADSVVLLVRHARAGKRSAWPGDDGQRPLDREGRRQARGLVGFATAFEPTAVLSADLARCRQTVQPLADALDAGIGVSNEFSDDDVADRPARSLRRLRFLAAPGQCTVVSSQGHAIPALLDALGVPGSHDCRKGSVSALFFSDGRLVHHDYYARPAGRRHERRS